MTEMANSKDAVQDSADKISGRLKLNNITDVLLESGHFGKLREAAIELYDLFAGITSVNDKSDFPADTKDIFLPNGKAISPIDAARCVQDFFRTSQFLKGIYNAVIEAQRRFPGETIEILYAGCGPFAALVVPLVALFDANRVKITLLDVHSRSLESAKRIFQFFGLENYVREYVQDDAASYIHSRPLHVIITETMQRALEKEPQVAIMRNLAPQLCRGGIFIPEKITIDVCLFDPRREFSMCAAQSGSSLENIKFERVRINIGRLTELTAESVGSFPSENYLPPVLLDLPEKADSNLSLMLSTKVRIYQSIVLDEYDSGITCPLILNDFAWSECGGQIEFQYFLGREPHFKYHCVE